MLKEQSESEIDVPNNWIKRDGPHGTRYEYGQLTVKVRNGGMVELWKRDNRIYGLQFPTMELAKEHATSILINHHFH